MEVSAACQALMGTVAFWVSSTLLEIQFRLVNFNLSLIVKLLSVKCDICSVIVQGITLNFQQARNFFCSLFFVLLLIMLRQRFHSSLRSKCPTILLQMSFSLPGILWPLVSSYATGWRNGIIFSRYLTPWFMTLYAPKYFAKTYCNPSL